MPNDGLANWLWYADDEDLPSNISEIVKKMDGFKGDYAARGVFARELVAEHESELFEHFNSLGADWERGNLNALVVKTKDGVNTEFATRMLSMFDIEASYDG